MVWRKEVHWYLHEVQVRGEALVGHSATPAGFTSLGIAVGQVEVPLPAQVTVVTLYVVLKIKHALMNITLLIFN